MERGTWRGMVGEDVRTERWEEEYVGTVDEEGRGGKSHSVGKAAVAVSAVGRDIVG